MTRPGDLVGQRFEIEALAGAGGMGRVFRARDLWTGELVALKMLRGDGGSAAKRFAHEAKALAGLSHTHVVRYVAHGVAERGELYLVMEWLQGEELARRLERGPLSIDETSALGRGVAEALAAAHLLGVIHRDLTPRNIFLEGHLVERVKVLDFGLARLGGATRVTKVGAILGTPGYMAPEQALLDKAIDGRADIFALGCVLYECLTRTPAFAAEGPKEALARLFFAEPARPSELRPEIPPLFEGLILRMMAKDPADRPSSGAQVVRALGELDRAPRRGDAAGAPFALSLGERRFISIVLATYTPSGGAQLGATLGDTSSSVELEPAGRAVGPEGSARRGEGALGAPCVVPILGAGPATDQAAQAARCALWIRAQGGARAIAIATGQTEMTGATPVPETIERAARMLLGFASDGDDEEGSLPLVAIDSTTARLLDGRFDVRDGDRGALLHGEREGVLGSRRYHRSLAPCVGRDRELSTLLGIALECIEEPRAQAALVTGPPGAGKSRLAEELLARLRDQGAPFDIWIGLWPKALPSSAGPTLVVLEDLQWDDGRAVRALDGMLRALADRPFMVLALARPEVHERFPTLWRGRGLCEIMLSPLARSASERLARQLLGGEARAGADAVERIVAQAQGNPFWIEELASAASAGGGEAIPPTLLATVQSRFHSLDDRDRQMIRAASLFGDVFWPGGVAALVGGEGRAAWVESRLLELTEREILIQRPESRFAGEIELAFRSRALRDAAYAMLTAADQVLGQKLATEWLARAHATNPKKS